MSGQLLLLSRPPHLLLYRSRIFAQAQRSKGLSGYLAQLQGSLRCWWSFAQVQRSARRWWSLAQVERAARRSRFPAQVELAARRLRFLAQVERAARRSRFFTQVLRSWCPSFEAPRRAIFLAMSRFWSHRYRPPCQLASPRYLCFRLLCALSLAVAAFACWVGKSLLLCPV